MTSHKNCDNCLGRSSDGTYWRLKPCSHDLCHDCKVIGQVKCTKCKSTIRQAERFIPYEIILGPQSVGGNFKQAQVVYFLITLLILSQYYISCYEDRSYSFRNSFRSQIDINEQLSYITHAYHKCVQETIVLNKRVSALELEAPKKLSKELQAEIDDQLDLFF